MKSSFITLALAALTAAQTTSNCNPLKKSCPPDPALGGHVDFDFKSKSDRFTSVGGEPSYGNDGATFTINKNGDAPTIGTKFYIMFGHVEIKMKASPGTGIVSSAILQSDDLDEIDWEWLGGDGGNVQSNYFGKGITGNYDRAAFHPVADSQGQYHTYAIDWTKDRIQWIIDGNVVRTLTPQDADNGNQYPQSPMNIRIGSWAGGASENEGTVEWAGGRTDFSQAPFKMLVQSLAITDYSTGQSYSYGDNSGSWQSIKSDGGKVEGTGSPNQGNNVINDPSQGEKTGMPHFPDFVPPHPTTHVTHPAIWPWVPAASATATATGTALGGVVQYSGAESTRGRTALTRPHVLLTGVSNIQATTNSRTKDTTTHAPTTTFTTADSITTSTILSSVSTSHTTSTIPSTTIMTSSTPSATTTKAATSTSETMTITSTTSPSRTSVTTSKTAKPSTLKKTSVTNVPSSSAIKNMTFTTSAQSTTGTSTTTSTSSISGAATITSTSASSTSSTAGVKPQSSSGSSTESSSLAPAPVNTHANAASGLRIPGAAIALGVIAAFA